MANNTSDRDRVGRIQIRKFEPYGEMDNPPVMGGELLWYDGTYQEIRLWKPTKAESKLALQGTASVGRDKKFLVHLTKAPSGKNYSLSGWVKHLDENGDVTGLEFGVFLYSSSLYRHSYSGGIFESEEQDKPQAKKQLFRTSAPAAAPAEDFDDIPF